MATLWKPLFEQGVEIDFAWRTFRWDNESFEKAHVHVVIVGFHCENRQAAAVRALVPVDASAAKQVQDKRELKDVFGRFGEVRNEDDGYAVRFSKEAAGKILRHRGFDQSRIASLLDVIYAKSLWAWDDAVRFEEGKKAHRNFLRYRNYIGKVSVGKSVYYVRFTITETIGDGNLVHSTFVSDVRVYDEGAGGLSIPDSNRAKVASAPLTDNRLANWFGAVKGGGEPKVIFDENGNRHEAKHINAYLTDAADVFVESRRKPICSDSEELVFGSMPNDGGHLSDWDDERKNAVVEKYPAAVQLFRKLLGSQEAINGISRWCLWLKGVSPSIVRSVPPVLDAVEKVREMRENSKRAATRKLAATPMLFGEIRQPEQGSYLLVPSVSSEKRDYVPMCFLDAHVIANNLAFVLPNATLYHFGVLTSSVHMAWMRTVCGRLEMRYRYSAAIVYNNYPWPFASSLSPCGENTNDESAKTAIEKTAQGILDARALYPDSSLADLYDPLAMPPELRKAHAANDAAVLKAYGWPTDLSEPEIVSRLFDIYAKLTVINKGRSTKSSASRNSTKNSGFSKTFACVKQR